MLYKAQNDVIKFFDGYSLMASKAKYKATKGEGPPRKMLQKLPIALAQVCNTSESLLIQIIQIVYLLYQSDEITKKVYSNTIESIQI